MKKLALSFLLCSASMFAASLQYSTSGLFSGPDVTGGGTGLKVGSSSVTFNGSPLTVCPPCVTIPTTISLGQFQITSTSPTGDVFPSSGTDSFTLTVTQDLPSAGTATTSVASISGTISESSSNIIVTFAPASFNIGLVSYLLTPATYSLPAPNTGNPLGTVSVQAYAAIPEPASLGLIGAGLLGLGVLVRRRAKK